MNTRLTLKTSKKSTAFLNKASMLRGMLISFLLFIIAPSTILAQDISILVIKQAGKSFSNQLIEQINSRFDRKTNNYTLHKINIEEQPDINTLSVHDLIITIGNQPAEYVLQAKTTTPILSILITKRAIELLEKEYIPTHTWLTISPDQPVSRQLLLIKHLLGKHITIGTIFGPVSNNDQKTVIKAANDYSLKLNYEIISITDQLISALKSLISNSEVVLALPDPVAFNRNTIRSILLLTYRKNIPVIGFSQSYVKAGALAAVYSTPEQISMQTTEIINDIYNNKFPVTKQQNPKYFSIAINKKILRVLRIKEIDNDALIELIKYDENLK